MQTIYLDISNKGVYPCIYSKQGDVDRKFLLVVTDGGVPFDCEDKAISVWYDGDSGEGNYTHIGEEDAISITGNKITVSLIQQMLANAGDGVLSVSINDANGGQIGLWNINYCVEEKPGANSEEAKKHYDAFSKTAADLALAAQTFSVDETLTKSGQPADAKKTGDLISESKTEIAVERARIDNLAKLEEGSTTGDAELMDIRVGADGTVYVNAGEAVRLQVAGLDAAKLDVAYDKTQNIPEGADLDDLIIPGKYSTVSADRVKTLLHMPPTTQAGTLLVLETYQSNRLFHVYVNTNGTIFVRSRGNEWRKWKKITTDDDPYNFGVTTADGVKMLSSCRKCSTTFNVQRDIEILDDGGNVVKWKTAGETATGVPYNSTHYYGRDAFFNFSLESIFSMFNNPNSLIYTFSGDPKTKLYTGGVCSSFVSWICGLPVYYTSYAIRKMLNYKTIRDLADLEIGDALICHTYDGDTQDHVAIVSNIYTDETGVVSVDISEAWPPCFRTLNMNAEKFWGLLNGTTREGDFYKVGRFDNHKIRTIPPLVINTDIITERGDNAYYEMGETILTQSLQDSFNVISPSGVEKTLVMADYASQGNQYGAMYDITVALNEVGRWTLYGSNNEKSHITIIKKGVATLEDGVVTLSGYEGCKPCGFTAVGVKTTPGGGFDPHIEEYKGQPCYAERLGIKSKEDPRYAGEITEDTFSVNFSDITNDSYIAVYVRVFYDTGCGQAFQDTNLQWL